MDQLLSSEPQHELAVDIKSLPGYGEIPAEVIAERYSVENNVPVLLDFQYLGEVHTYAVWIFDEKSEKEELKWVDRRFMLVKPNREKFYYDTECREDLIKTLESFFKLSPVTLANIEN